jgi:riboflavin-specific deaminase-like protein
MCPSWHSAHALSDTASVDSGMMLLGRVKEKMSAFSAATKDVNVPVATIAYAQTIDGSIAPVDRSRLDISSGISFQLLHSLRTLHSGVLIGVNTLFIDTPRLNVRDPLPDIPMPFAQPRPIVIDSNLRFLDLPSKGMRLSNPIICTCVAPGSQLWSRGLTRIAEVGGTLVHCERGVDGKCNLRSAFSALKREANVQSILVEGGAGIIQSVLEQQLAHQVLVTVRPCYFGGFRSMTGQLAAPAVLHNVSAASIGGDLIMHGMLWTKEEIAASMASVLGSDKESSGALDAPACEAETGSSETTESASASVESAGSASSGSADSASTEGPVYMESDGESNEGRRRVQFLIPR